jgi:hypothetical protein
MGPSTEPCGTLRLQEMLREGAAGTDTLGSASEVGFNEVEDMAGESETGVKSG